MNTQAYLNVMKNPYIHIIGHPDDGRFPVDYERLVRGAKETHTLLELNNSSQRPEGFRVNTEENAKVMLELCKKKASISQQEATLTLISMLVGLAASKSSFRRPISQKS